MARPEITTVLTEFAEYLGQENKKIKTAIGNLESLPTTHKDSIVAAMIEFGQRLNELSSGASGINDSATNEISTLSAKKIFELLNQAKSDIKNELLGGEVDASIDTFKELGEMLKGIQTGEDGLNKLIQKISQTNEALTTLNQKFTALDGMNLKEVYTRGYNK